MEAITGCKGDAQEVLTSTDYAYVATSSGLLIAGIWNPFDIAWSGCFESSHSFLNVAGDGKTVVTAKANELWAWDVSDPKNPVPSTWYSTSAIVDVAVQGDYAYIVTSSGSLDILQLTGSSPSLVGSHKENLKDMLFSLAVAGTRAYTAEKGGKIFVFDIGSPSSPKMLKSTIGMPDQQAFHIDGDTLFVGTTKRRLALFDLTDPETPSQEGQVLELPNAYFSGNGMIHTSGNRAYLATMTEHFYVVDITNPDKLKLLQTVSTPGITKGIAGEGKYLFVADGIGGLRVFEDKCP